MKQSFFKEVFFIAIVGFSLFLIISLASYHWNIFHLKAASKNSNIFGITGYYIADFLFMTFGILAYVVIIFFVIYVYKVTFKSKPFLFDLIVFLILVFSFENIIALYFPKSISYGNIEFHVSGELSNFFVSLMIPYLNKSGTFFVNLILFVISFLILFRISILRLLELKSREKEKEIENEKEKRKLEISFEPQKKKFKKLDISLLNKPPEK